jgi:hypothetical protein
LNQRLTRRDRIADVYEDALNPQPAELRSNGGPAIGFQPPADGQVRFDIRHRRFGDRHFGRKGLPIVNKTRDSDGHNPGNHPTTSNHGNTLRHRREDVRDIYTQLRKRSLLNFR